MSLSFSGLPIRKQVAILALVAMVPAILFLAWLGIHEWRNASRDAYDKARIVAIGIAGSLDLLLRDSEAMMGRLAQRPLIKSLDAKNCDPYLSEFVQLHPEYTTLATVDPEGNRVCSGLANPRGQFRNLSWFQGALRSGQFATGDASVGSATGRRISVLSYPISDAQGRISGLMVMPLDLVNLSQRLLATVPTSVIVTVTDRRGNILLRSREPEAWVGKPRPAGFAELSSDEPEGFTRSAGVDGVRRLYAWVTVPGTGWQVVAGMPEKDVFADSRAAAQWSIAIGVSTLLLALWLVYRISRTISRPIGELARTSAAVAAGNTAVRASLSGPSEIREVANKFNLMLDAREKSERALRDSQQLLRQTFLSLDQAVFVVKSDTRSIIACNTAVEQIFGYTEEQMLGRNVEVLHVDREAFEEFGKRLFPALEKDGVFRSELRMRHKKGMLFPAENTVTPILDDAGRLIAAVSVIRDITERKRAEALLRARLLLSELGQTGSTGELLQAAIDAAEEVTGSQIGFCHFVDPDQEHVMPQTWSTNTLKHACAAESKNRHYPISEAGVWADCFHMRAPVIHNDYAGLPHKKGMPEGHANVTRELVVPILREGKVTEIMGVGNKASDYDQKDVEAVQLIASMTQDVLDRRRAESELRESDNRFSAVFQSSPIGISVSRVADGKLLEVNDAALRLYAYRREEVIGRTVAELRIYANPAQRAELVERLRRDGKVERFPIDARRSSGEIRILEITARIVELQGEQCLAAMMVDVTERKRLEDVHLQAQKLESLGTLAGGIAHDFNNILAAIKGNADLAAEDMGPDHLAAESLQEIRKASARASELVRRIMTFGRPTEARQEAVDLRVVVAEVLKLLRSTLPAAITLATEFGEDTPWVLADAGQIHEAIVNLTTNAAHAIGPRPGVIEYRLEPLEIRPEQPHGIFDLYGGLYACLTVTDSGCGMEAGTTARIFDAFYTTKPLGEGTGLGLSMVHGIMRSHGGAVTVESAPGKGSSFRLYFPAVKKERQPPVDQAVETQVMVPGQRVLYVDDEEALVSLARRVLSRLGHGILGFTDPKQALAAFRAAPQEFDIVVTDLSMPHMSGFDLAREVMALRPDIPVLMTTGYIRAEDENLAREAGIRELVLKPIKIDELGRMLDRLFRDTKEASVKAEVLTTGSSRSD